MELNVVMTFHPTEKGGSVTAEDCFLLDAGKTGLQETSGQGWSGREIRSGHSESRDSRIPYALHRGKPEHGNQAQDATGN